jgi:hypothetical protein
MQDRFYCLLTFQQQNNPSYQSSVLSKVVGSCSINYVGTTAPKFSAIALI